MSLKLRGKPPANGDMKKIFGVIIIEKNGKKNNNIVISRGQIAWIAFEKMGIWLSNEKET